jgi:hypothetical protein
VRIAELPNWLRRDGEPPSLSTHVFAREPVEAL